VTAGGGGTGTLSDAGDSPGEVETGADQVEAGAAGRSERRRPWALIVVAMVPIMIVLVITVPIGQNTLATRLTAGVQALWARIGPSPAVLAEARTFDGTPAVGALFTVSGGKPATHFCTASVVDSPEGDILMTAAHCVAGANVGPFDFIPGYANGRAPYGIWRVTKIVVDSAWTSTASINDDFAFLVVAAGPHGTKIQNVTGGERLGSSLGMPAGALVQVAGYPNSGQAPIVCDNRVLSFTATQLQFNCGGYTDGTSGSALLTDVNPLTGLGTIIGVIGGFQQGGDYASVSYAARLGPHADALFQTATGDASADLAQG
jgi:V8-like Glu-specific endopeptidase